MSEKIINNIKKYGDYAGVLKHGTSEEKKLVSHYINDEITEMQDRGVCD